MNEIDVTLSRQRVIEFLQRARSSVSMEDLRIVVEHDITAAQKIAELEDELRETVEQSE